MSDSELYYKDLYKSFSEVRSELKKLAPQFAELVVELDCLWTVHTDSDGLFKVTGRLDYEGCAYINGFGDKFFFTGNCIYYAGGYGCYEVTFYRDGKLAIRVMTSRGARNITNADYNIFVTVTRRDADINMRKFVKCALPEVQDFYMKATKFVDAHWV